MQVGDPDGHGQFAILDDDGHSLLCHDCGRRSRNLGLHVRVHNHTAVTYRLAHGLAVGCKLMAADARAAIGRAAKTNPACVAALEANRDPVRARAGNRRESHHRPQLVELRRQNVRKRCTGRMLTEAEICQLQALTDLREWAQAVRRLTETGATVRGIALAVGVNPMTAHGRVSRLAPQR